MGGEVTVFDWVNLIVAGLGSIGTIAALLFAVKVWRDESERAREEARRRESDAKARAEADEQWQAERVAASITVERGALGGPLQGERYTTYATVHNESGMPIYDVRVIDLTEQGEPRAASLSYVPPGGTGHVHLQMRTSRKVDGQPLPLSFRDAGERWWSKCHDGHLTRHEHDPNPRPSSMGVLVDPPDEDGGHSEHSPVMRYHAGLLAMEYEPD